MLMQFPIFHIFKTTPNIAPKMMTTLAAVLLIPVVYGFPRTSPPAALYNTGPGLVPNEYIVKLRDGSSAATLDSTIRPFRANVTHTYQTLFHGFAANLDDQTLDQLLHDPQVEYIQQDSWASIAVVESSTVDQANAEWGLGRISYRKKGSKIYTYDSSGGASTCSYILDTGVDASHPDFGGRASQLRSFINGSEKDDHGHGTHCAGTAGSTTYGVAKQTKILGVKVLDRSGKGKWAGINSALEWVAGDHESRGCKGVFVNLSIDGPDSKSTKEMMAKLVGLGIFIAGAASNFNKDVGNNTPGSEPSICTVGATDSQDKKALFSNFGKALDILAPGMTIVSTVPGGGKQDMSGTSMATPHIVGLAAYLYAIEKPESSASLCKRIQDLANKDIIQDLPADTINLLAFNNNPGGQ